ncbi:MAG TPA: 30S ribosomal protein THX [Burkholderiales bacterium]|nr:30S ribosomal protein THX [Burkholderiales bacterium]
MRGASLIGHFSTHDSPTETTMGKGDKRTRKGKIYRGSYGKTRPGRPKKKNKKK